MKQITLAPLFLLLFIHCYDKPDLSTKQIYSEWPAREFRKESMPIDSIQINGKYSFFMNKSEVSEVFGDLKLSDSIADHTYFIQKFEKSNSKFYVYKKGFTVVYQCDDVFFPVCIDFKATPLEMTCGSKITLNSDIRSVILLDYFPLSCLTSRGYLGNYNFGYILVCEDNSNNGYYQWVLRVYQDKIDRIQLLSFENVFQSK